MTTPSGAPATQAQMLAPQERLVNLIDRIDGIVWEADPVSFQFTFVSKQAERLLGYACDAWYAPDFWASHIHPEDREQTVAYCALQTQAGIDHAFEYRMLSADGRVVWLKDSVTVEVRDGMAVALSGIMVDVTAEKQAQQAVAEQVYFLQQLGDTIPNPIFWKDAQGRYRGCNRAFEDYIGIARTDLVGKTVHDIAPRALAEQYAAADQALFEQGGTQTYDAHVQYHDGTQRYVTFYKAVFSQSDGTRGGLVGVMLDVTERQRLTESLQAKNDALQRNAASLQAVLTHMPQGISVFDEHLRLRYWNAGMGEVLDLPSEVLAAGVHFDDLIRIPARRGEYGPGDPEQHVARIHKLALQFEPHQFERTRPCGTTHLVSGKPMVVDDKLAGFITTYTDITERKRAEEALLLSDTVFNHSTQGITVTDPQRRILKVNRAFCAITGYEEHEVVGQTHAILSSGRQEASFYQAMWREIDDTGSWSGEIWNRRKSGELFAEHLSITCVRNAAGEVLHYIGIFSDISHYKAAQRQIEHLSFFDALTSLPNRALLQDRLQQAVLNASRHQTRVAVLALDLHHLARINELFGHPIGDQLLIAVAQRWQAVIRAGDTLSRHISDEFAVVFDDCPSACAADELAQRLLGELSRPFMLSGHEVSINACIGISMFPDDGATPDLLLKHAEVALTHARESGIGCYQFYREGMNHASMERLLIDSSLRQALRRHEFVVHYQPQVELATGRLTGMEALLRWQHPEMGLVSPARFIPIAEETGQIVDIGRWVLRQACAQTKAWSELGHTQLRVAVNVSARQLSQSDFAADVTRILQETALSPSQLELELTESLIMNRTEQVVQVMQKLRSIGVTFSIDDFGTGYSSLSQLKRFPIDKLKIDQAFTRDIGSDEGSTAITRAVIALGQSMRLQVVAEGVETPEQHAFLAAHGCHGMQGYLFSKPLPAQEFLAFLEQHCPCVTEPEWQI